MTEIEIFINDLMLTGKSLGSAREAALAQFGDEARAVKLKNIPEYERLYGTAARLATEQERAAAATSATVLRLSIRSSSQGTFRPNAQFEAANAPEIAFHAAAICTLATGAEYRVETTGGRLVKVTPTAPVAAPTDLERAIGVALETGERLSAIKNVAFTQYGVTPEQWAAVSWANVQGSYAA